MKLNLEGRKELRKSVEILLASSPKNKKIQLPKETLETLLFETMEGKDGPAKLPVWSGEFLRKLDLSQVDFSGVCWDLESLGANRDEINKRFDAPEVLNKYEQIREDFIIDYSNTNAHINLGHTYPPNMFVINRCNFKNTTLDTEGKLFSDIIILNSDLSNTGLTLASQDYDKIDIIIYNSNFENCDLHNVSIPIDIFVGDENITKSNFKNTALNIEYSSGMSIETQEAIELYEENSHNNWEGCYLNGKLITPLKSQAELETIKQANVKAYSEYKDETIKGVLDEIKGQIGEKVNPLANDTNSSKKHK